MPTETELRGTGRTTRLALWYLQECLSRPGKWIIIKDHHPTRDASRRLWAMLLNCFESLYVGIQYRSDNDGFKIRVLPLHSKETEGPQ